MQQQNYYSLNYNLYQHNDSIFLLKNSSCNRPQNSYLSNYKIYTNSIIGNNFTSLNKIPINNQEKWIDIIFIIIISLIAFSSYFYRKQIKNKFNFLSNIKIYSQITRESFSYFDKYEARISFIIYTLTFSILTYKILCLLFPNQYNNIQYWIKIAILIYLITSVKFIITKIIAIIFKIAEEIKLYNQHSNIFNHILALIILPFTIFISYNNHPKYIYKIIFTLYIISIIIKTLKILKENFSFFKFNTLYIFLYICTFDILPFFIFIKILNISVLYIINNLLI